MDTIPINVFLAGRSYRIRVAPADEEAVRKAVKAADDSIMDLRQQYAGRDDQDFVAMCLLMYATDAATGMPTQLVQEAISKLVSDIDAALER